MTTIFSLLDPDDFGKNRGTDGISSGAGGSRAKAPKLEMFVRKGSRLPLRSRNNQTARKLARIHKGFRRGRYWGQRPGRSVSTQGAKVRSVIKARYQRAGRQPARTKLARHANYLQNRERGEIEKGEVRKFFTADRNGLDAKDVIDEAKKKFGTIVGYHKIILSPGDNSISLEQYARDVMEEWQEALGKQFDWWGIVHKNTDHYHVHVIVAGQDDLGHGLHFDRENLALLREISDEYLSRMRFLERDLDLAVEMKLGEMMRTLDDAGKVLEMGLSRAAEWLDQVLAGLRTDEDYKKEWEALGLGKIYDLGRPFENLEKVKSAEKGDKGDKELEQSQEKELGLEPAAHKTIGLEHEVNPKKEAEAEGTGRAEGEGFQKEPDPQPGTWMQQQKTLNENPEEGGQMTPGSGDQAKEDPERDDDDLKRR